MINPLDVKLLSFISKNKMTFMLVVLLIGNIYQYIDNRAIAAQASEDKKELTQKILEINKEATQYERQRSEKLEFLLSSLAKTPTNGNAK
jgi:hypothetical protein